MGDDNDGKPVEITEEDWKSIDRATEKSKDALHKELDKKGKP